MQKLARFLGGRDRNRKLAESLFHSILGRQPNEEDLKIAASAVLTKKGLEQQIAAMIQSHEFQVMRLPHLMAAATQNYRGEKVFFLHVPKTAGTSLRLALIDAMGIPALDRYRRNGTWNSYSEEFLKVWPLLVGHTNVGNFPTGTHRGMTVFREPRARILSKYRQSTRARFETPVHQKDLASVGVRRILEEGPRSLDLWLEREHPVDLLTWFVDFPNVRLRDKEKGEGDSWIVRRGFSLEILKYDQSEIREALERGIRKIQVAEWMHNKAGMDTLLVRLLGRPLDLEIPKANVVLPKQVETTIQLTANHHKKLMEIHEQSQIVFRVAENQGLISRLSQEESDEQFEIAAKRLGFRL